MIKLYQEIAKQAAENKMDLVSCEDGFDQDDWDNWVAYTKEGTRNYFIFFTHRFWVRVNFL